MNSTKLGAAVDAITDAAAVISGMTFCNMFLLCERLGHWPLSDRTLLLGSFTQATK